MLHALRSAAACCAAAVAIAGCGADEAPDTTQRDVAANIELVADLPQDGITLGASDAPATLTVYDSLDAFNRGLFLSELPDIVREHVRSGDLNVELQTVTAAGAGQAADSGATDAARLAHAAGLQDKLWDFYGALTARYVGVVDQAVLDAALDDVPELDAGEARAQVRSARVAAAIERANASAAANDVTALPAYTITRGKGKPKPLDAACVGCLVRNVDRALAKSEPERERKQPAREPEKKQQAKGKAKAKATPSAAG